MDFSEFEGLAREIFEEIPEAYREGVDGLTVRREAATHPDLPGVYTLGECLTEEHPSDFGSADTTRSVIALYWGSFVALSERSPDFDWHEETWETLTHELRHHLESLAGDDSLEGVDYAADETYKRFEGRRFDPWYYQRGEEVEAGVYRVERMWYIEVTWLPEWAAATEPIEFTWCGRPYRIPRPAEMGDVHFVLVHGLEGAPDEVSEADYDRGRDRTASGSEEESVEVVLVRERGWWEQVRALFGSGRPMVLESEAKAERMGPVG